MNNTIKILIIIVILLFLGVGGLFAYYYIFRLSQTLPVANTNSVSPSAQNYTAPVVAQKILEEREMTAQEKTDAGLDPAKPAKLIIKTSPYNPDATIRIIDTSANQ